MLMLSTMATAQQEEKKNIPYFISVKGFNNQIFRINVWSIKAYHPYYPIDSDYRTQIDFIDKSMMGAKDDPEDIDLMLAPDYSKQCKKS